MASIAAFSLASNVLQFVQFTSQLISTGCEIYSSANGASERNIELERVYETLGAFMSSLETQGTTRTISETQAGIFIPAQTTENLSHIRALNDLAKECAQLCHELLETIQKLKVQGGRWRPFKSFKAALEASWDSKKVANLEARLDRFQRVTLFHFFPILRDQQCAQMQMVAVLRQEIYSIQVEQNLKLDAIIDDLRLKPEEKKGEVLEKKGGWKKMWQSTKRAMTFKRSKDCPIEPDFI